MTRLRYQTGGLTHSSNIMMEKPAVMRPRYSPWERRTAGTGVPETVVRVSVVLFRPPVCLEGELGQRLPWRAVTSMRRRFMSSMVQPMPVRATAARSMPFVFAPVDAMT